MGEPINLMASLKDMSPRSKPGTKMAISITSEDLLFDPDDKELAKAVATIMVCQIRENLRQGLGPAGETLPGLQPSTLVRRIAETEQAHRNGAAAPQYVNNEFRHQVANNYTRDYVAPKLGAFKPHIGGPRGVLSGMLVKSFAARPGKDGKSVTIYVSAKRGQPRPALTDRKAETKSALESVFADVPIWSPAANSTPQMKSAMQLAAEGLFGKNRRRMKLKWRDVKRLASNLVDTIEAVSELGETASEE